MNIEGRAPLCGQGFLPGLMQSVDSIANSGINIAGKIQHLKAQMKNAKSEREYIKAQTELVKMQALAAKAGITSATEQSAKNQDVTRWLVLGTAGVASALALMGG